MDGEADVGGSLTSGNMPPAPVLAVAFKIHKGWVKADDIAIMGVMVEKYRPIVPIIVKNNISGTGIGHKPKAAVFKLVKSIVFSEIIPEAFEIGSHNDRQIENKES